MTDIQYISAEEIIASYDEKSKSRLEVCKSCEYLDKETHVCSQCSCYMINKVTLGYAVCPKGKWNE